MGHPNTALEGAKRADKSIEAVVISDVYGFTSGVSWQEEPALTEEKHVVWEWTTG